MNLSIYSIVRLYMVKSGIQPTNTDKNRQAKIAEKVFSSVKKEISITYYNKRLEKVFEKTHGRKMRRFWQISSLFSSMGGLMDKFRDGFRHFRLIFRPSLEA